MIQSSWLLQRECVLTLYPNRFLSKFAQHRETESFLFPTKISRQDPWKKKDEALMMWGWVGVMKDMIHFYIHSLLYVYAVFPRLLLLYYPFISVIFDSPICLRFGVV